MAPARSWGASARARLFPVVVLGGAVVALGGIVRHGHRASSTDAIPPPNALRRALLAARRHGPPSDPAPSLLLLAAPGCEPCERARHDLRYLVRPEDLGVRSAVLLTTDESGASGGLAAAVTPTYFLTDDRDRLLAVARGYHPPVSLRRWMRETLGRDPP